MAEKNANPFLQEKNVEREWHDRIGNDFWQILLRTSLLVENFDRLLAEKDPSICVGYKSQKDILAQGMALVAILDYDDFLFLPQEISLLAVARGVSTEQFVGQWNGNLLDPAKGRMKSGNITSESFHLLPVMGMPMQSILEALGIALAMRLEKHPKLVVFPTTREALLSTDGIECLTIIAKNKAPIAILILDGDVEDFGDSAGIRTANVVDDDIFLTLKKLKNQMDRVRRQQEPSILYFSKSLDGTQKKLSSAIVEILAKRKCIIPESMESQIIEEIQYGVDRAKMIPLPPKSTVIQDVRKFVPESLEDDWRKWRLAHGK